MDDSQKVLTRQVSASVLIEETNEYVVKFREGSGIGVDPMIEHYLQEGMKPVLEHCDENQLGVLSRFEYRVEIPEETVVGDIRKLWQRTFVLQLSQMREGGGYQKGIDAIVKCAIVRRDRNDDGGTAVFSDVVSERVTLTEEEVTAIGGGFIPPSTDKRLTAGSKRDEIAGVLVASHNATVSQFVSTDAHAVVLKVYGSTDVNGFRSLRETEWSRDTVDAAVMVRGEGWRDSNRFLCRAFLRRVVRAIVAQKSDSAEEASRRTAKHWTIAFCSWDNAAEVWNMGVTEDTHDNHASGENSSLRTGTLPDASAVAEYLKKVDRLDDDKRLEAFGDDATVDLAAYLLAKIPVEELKHVLSEEFMDAEGAARLLGISANLVGRYARANRLPSFRTGKQARMFRRSDVIEFGQGERKAGNPEFSKKSDENAP